MPATPRIIAVAQQKGGVGKTTVTLNLAAAVANRGWRVLVIDLDPQSNSSKTLLPDYRDRLNGGMFTVNDLMAPDIEYGDIDQAITETDWPGVELIPSEQMFQTRDADGSTGLEKRLTVALRGLTKRYDVILIDCPPSLGKITANGLLAATEVLTVARPDGYSVDALDELQSTIRALNKVYDQNLSVTGIVVNEFTHTNEAATHLDAIQELEWPILAVVPKRVALTQAASAHKSVFTVDRPDTGDVIAVFERLVADLRIVGEGREP